MSAHLRTDIGNMNECDHAHSSPPSESATSRWKNYNLLDLRFATLVVVSIALIIWLRLLPQPYLRGGVGSRRRHVQRHARGAALQSAARQRGRARDSQERTLRPGGASLPRKANPRPEGLAGIPQQQPQAGLQIQPAVLCWAWVDGENISYMLVGKGYAKFSGAAESERRRILTLLQADAKEHHRGLWSSLAPYVKNKSAAVLSPTEDERTLK